MKTMRLDKLILKHYSKSALYPILLIEVLLLVLYFSINIYTNQKTEESLREEVRAVMPHMVRQTAQSINAVFIQINKQTAYFAQANADLLTNPRLYNIPGEQPQFAISPNKALYQTNLEDGSSLFFTHGDTLTPLQKEKAYRTTALNPLYRHLVQDIPNVAAAYLNTPDDMNRLYPFIKKVYEQYPADLNMEEYNFYYLADESHNPEKKPVWTGVYLDPAGLGWMLSCIAPVYIGTKLAGVVGLDVTTSDIVNNVLKMDLPWKASAFLADDNGMILAMSPKAEQVFGLKELKEHVYSSAISKEQQKPEDFNLFKNKNKTISEVFRNIYKSKEQLHFVDIGSVPVFIVQDKITETGWRLFILVEPEIVFSSAKRNAMIASYIGYGVIVIMVVFYLVFFLILRKKAKSMSDSIAAPITSLATATSNIGNAQINTTISLSGISEIDSLTNNFNVMTGELEARNKKLIEHQVKIKIQEKDAELAYAQGMFEAASGYLHNVGNSITALNSNIMDLHEIIKSTDQYPAVFTRLRQNFDPQILERFEDVLINKTVPRLKTGVDKISQVRETIQQTITHQQQSYKESKDSLIPVEFDLSELVKDLVAEFAQKYPKVNFTSSIKELFVIKNHRIQMLNGLTNVLKNAVEACNYQGNISVDLSVNQMAGIITITDDGYGIDPKNMPKMLNAGFTTKISGNGFGLHSFSVFLSAQKNSLQITSPGVNQGTTVVIEVQYA